MEAGELARWTRFAAKGGIGKCTAIQDCVAERAEDLMFLKDDEVTVLMQLPDQDGVGLYLGYCEGVVGRFIGTHVRFHSKLKKPIMTKRSSTSASVSGKAGSSTSSPSPNFRGSLGAGRGSASPGLDMGGGFRVMVSSPPPPSTPHARTPSFSQSQSLTFSPPPHTSQQLPTPPPQTQAQIYPSPDSTISSPSASSTSPSSAPSSPPAPAPPTESPVSVLRTRTRSTRVPPPVVPIELLESVAADEEMHTQSQNKVPPPPDSSGTDITPKTSGIVHRHEHPHKPSSSSSLASSTTSHVHSQHSNDTNTDTSNVFSTTNTALVPTATNTPTYTSTLTHSPSPTPSQASSSQPGGEQLLPGLAPIQPLSIKHSPPRVRQDVQTQREEREKKEREEEEERVRDSIVSTSTVPSTYNSSMYQPSPSPSPPPTATPHEAAAAASRGADESYQFDDPSTRISVAMSDGEVGIGLSLLGGMMSGAGEHMGGNESGSESDGGAVDDNRKGKVVNGVKRVSSGKSSRRIRRRSDASESEGSGSERYGDGWGSGSSAGGSERKLERKKSQASKKLSEEILSRESKSSSESGSEYESSSDDDDESNTKVQAQPQPRKSQSTSTTPELKSPSRTSFDSVDSTAEGPPAITMPPSPISPASPSSQSHFPAFPTSPSALPPNSSALPASILPTSPILPVPLARPGPMTQRPSSRSVSSTQTTSTQPDTDDWEGASDIYENYRYSRYSMGSGSTSKMSMHSMAGTPDHFQELPPPVPTGRPSMERSESMDSHSLYSRSSVSTTASSLVLPGIGAGVSAAPISANNTPRPGQGFAVNQAQVNQAQVQGGLSGTGRKDRPASLKLNNNASPLLHTSFGTPLTSPPVTGQQRSGASSLLSPPLSTSPHPLHSPTFGSGIASSLRNKLESERGGVGGVISPLPSPSIRDEEEHVEGRRIVIEDDEEAPDVSGGDMTRQDDSFAASEESMDTASTAHQTLLHIPESDISMANTSTASGNPPLSPLSSFPLPPQQPHLRPGMSEFLNAQRTSGSGGSLSPGLSPGVSPVGRVSPGERGASPINRTSLFLPHPNAPRPSPSPVGPMYARPPHLLSPPPHQQQFNPVQIVPPGIATIHALHQAVAARYAPNGQLRRTTIYGRFEFDLMASEGPVPVTFSMEPPPPPPPIPAMGTSGMAKRSPEPGLGSSPLAKSEVLNSAPISRKSSPQPLAPPAWENGSQQQQHNEIGLGVGMNSMNTLAPPSNGNVIQRAGFVPQAIGVRPRSRSFSGFNSDSSSQPIGRSREEPVMSGTGQLNFGRTLSANVAGGSPLQLNVGRTQSVSAAPPPLSTSNPPTAARPPQAPSPLSMPQYNNSTSSLRSSMKSPTSPLSPTSFGIPPTVPSPLNRQGSNRLRKAASSTALTNDSSTTSPFGSTPPLRLPRRNLSLAAPELPAPSPATSSMPPPRRNTTAAQESPIPSPTTSSMPPLSSISRSSNKNAPQDLPTSLVQSRSFGRRQGSVDTMASQTSETRVISPVPTTLGRNTSLRKKLSLPSLRSRSIQLSRQDDTVSSPLSIEHDNEMVQAENIEFELVRPSIPQASSTRTSEDSAFAQRENLPMPLDSRPSFLGHLRPDSPATSMTSGASSIPRSPIGESMPTAKPPKSAEAESSMDAHRQRELKWVGLMSAVPAAQAKKNKKVKKLLMEGVPSSVRYLVWAHLTDSKARGMPGLYSQLGKRSKVPAFDDIERDAQRCYPDHPQLQGTRGTLTALLQAYLTMVPDIQYETGLTFIAGRLLILAPDEDAFWIFVSLMDTHLRPWFSKNTIQMEVDASLFSKALENNDAQVAKKLYVDLGISQSSVCRPWFASLFAQSLPVDYLHRVWDIFLYEGVAFLFRVGMAIVHCCRHYLVQSTSEAAALEYLIHPPPACLPSTTEEFINIALSFKLKDDDVRKQRIKMEAQVKRQTQTRILSTPGLGGAKPGAAISLPKT